jgi:hypothetical protein
MAMAFNSQDFIESNVWSKEKLKQVKAITLKALTAYLWGKMRVEGNFQALREFVQTFLRPSDTLITFNWDVSLEKALFTRDEEFDIPYSYSRKQQGNNFVILTPHGSIDWLLRKDVHSQRLRSKTITLDESVCVYPEFNFAKDPKLADLQPVIVPPISSKDFGISFLTRTWKSIYHAVADATDLHIYGYSLPREDQFARFVFRRAVRTNLISVERKKKRSLKLTVVNPDDSVVITFQRLTGPEVGQFRFFHATFEDYVGSMNGESDD